MSLKKWVVSDLNKEKAFEIAEKYDISSFLAMMLQIRGFENDDEINSFFNQDVILSDPFEYADMKKAVDRVNSAVDNFEKICVYGDYDADGVTSTALLYSYLNQRGANVVYFIPDRKDGYGLNKNAIEKLKTEEVKLIITVDNGVSCFSEVEFATSLGMDVVITDHHEVPKKIPNAVAVVDPHREDCKIPFKDFAGVGVAFKFVCAMENNENLQNILDEYVDLVAIGTLADMVSLSSENKILVNLGIKRLSHKDRLGIKCLLNVADVLDKEITSSLISYSIVPRLNAVGRLSLAEKAVKLLISDYEEEAELLSSELNDFNLERKSIEAEILEKVEDKLKKNSEIFLDRVIVVDGDDFHPGVIGIVASKIVDLYGKPCIIISKNGIKAKASGRSVEGFHIYDAAKSWFDKNITDEMNFGGHPMAIGFSMPSFCIEDFRKEINRYAKTFEKMPLPQIKIDCKLKPQSLSVDFVDELSLFEPFGKDNPMPIFGLYGMTIENIQPVGGGKHLRLNLSRDGHKIIAMKFSTTIENFGFIEGDIVDIAATFNKNEFRGKVSLSIFIKDLKFSNILTDDFIENNRLYEAVKRGENRNLKIPSREDFAKVYRYLKNIRRWNNTLYLLCYRINEKSINLCTLRFILDIMQELNLIKLSRNQNKYDISFLDIQNKVDLDSSNFMIYLKKMESAYV